MQLLLGNELTVGVGHVNRSGTEQDRRAPGGECGNVGGESRHHGLNAGNRTQFDEGNFQHVLSFRQSGNSGGNLCADRL